MSTPTLTLTDGRSTLTFDVRTCADLDAAYSVLSSYLTSTTPEARHEAEQPEKPEVSDHGTTYRPITRRRWSDAERKAIGEDFTAAYLNDVAVDFDRLAEKYGRTRAAIVAEQGRWKTENFEN